MKALLHQSSQQLWHADLTCYTAMISNVRPRKHRQVRRKSTVVCIGSAFAADASLGSFTLIAPENPNLNETVVVDVRSEQSARLIGIVQACDKVPLKEDLTIILNDREFVRDLNDTKSSMWQNRYRDASTGRSLLDIALLRKIAAHRINRRVIFKSKGRPDDVDYCGILANHVLKGSVG